MLAPMYHESVVGMGVCARELADALGPHRVLSLEARLDDVEPVGPDRSGMAPATK